MLKIIKTLFLLIATVVALSACGNSASLKEESKAAVKQAQTAFNEKAKKPNKTSGKIHFYLPFGYDIKDKNSNNIILANGSKTYILFHNPKESKSSDVVYKASVAQYKKLDTNQSFSNNKNIGFILIKHLEDDLNELTVGIGGTKITTQTETSHLKDEATYMMKIVKSVNYKK